MIFHELSTRGWTVGLINHLWQSTAIALLAWILTVALCRNPARVRYGIWVFASLKFLIPFSLLTNFGAYWAKPVVSNQPGRGVFYYVIEEFNGPLRQMQTPAAPTGSTLHALPIAFSIVAAVWLFGFALLHAKWISGWRHAIRMARTAQPVSEGREFNALRRAEHAARLSSQVPLLLSTCETEPGVFGVIHPVLLWPDGLSQRLDDAQIEAIMVHEVEHLRRRDNLTSAIHAFVEALFWFHPLVRWMSTKLNEERERACDERVIEQNARPEAYAQSILTVCAFCMEPPTPCVSGVSGADLKERILRILTRRSAVALSSTKKLALSATAAMILAAPFGFGVLRGQASQASPSTSPQTAVPPDLPKYEVATIKPTTETDNRRTMMLTPDGTSMHGVDFQLLLQQAFGVERDRILDAPKWVQSNRYDIEAKVAPEEAPKMDRLKLEQRRAMLLTLLEQRLNLKYHHETRELPTYALVVAKGGPKLTESKPGGDPMPGPDGRVVTAGPGAPTPPPGGPEPAPSGASRERVGGMMRMSPGGIEAHGGTTNFLTHALSGVLGRTVIDKTGLTGNYDFTLNWTPDESMRAAMGGPQDGPTREDASSDSAGPTLFTAIQEQLGLKLESQKGTVDVIVIDHVDQPSEN